MPLIAIITAGAGELGTAAAAATTAEAAAAAAAAKAAAIAAAETAAATTAATTAATAAAPAAASALPGVVGGASPTLSAAAPVSEGIAATTPTEAALTANQVNAANPGITETLGTQGGANPALTQAGPAPTVPQGIDQGLNVQGGIPQGGFDAYGQFTQAPGPIDPAATAAKPYVNGPPSGGIGNPIDINAGLERGIDYEAIPGVDVAHAGAETSKTGLQKGFESALKFSKDYPIATSLGMSVLGSAINQPSSSSAPPKKQYARKDMSGFQASEPSTIAYNPIFKPTPYADGGIASYAVGGPVETMSAQNAISGNMMYPQSQLQTDMYSNPMVQRPMPSPVISSGIDAPVGMYTGEQMYAKGGTTVSTDASKRYAQMMGIRSAEQQRADEEYLDAYAKREMGKSINTDTDVDTRTKDPLNASLTSLKKIGKRVGIKPVELPKSNTTDSNVFHAAANGGIMHSLGGYSDGGRLLKGPGDGVSDSIPATIGNRQPARLADGEFVVPARIVSELGNGSTEAGARKLYEMMDRVQASRKKSIGKGKVAVNSKAAKHLPK